MVKWEQIETECGDYRSGFVATFRKYEGQPTDEKVRGRVVRVTAASFARHAGIPKQTFDGWVKRSNRPDPGLPVPRDAVKVAGDLRRYARQEPEAVVEGIMDAPESVQDRIFDELKMRRAGVDNSPANRKTAESVVDEEYGKPIRRAIQAMQLPPIVDAIREARDGLARMRAEGELTPEMLVPIIAERDRLSVEIDEARFVLSDGEVSR